MIHRILKTIILMIALLLTVSCNGDGNKLLGGSSLNCEQGWAEKMKDYPLGSIKEYSNVTYVNNGGTERVIMEMNEREDVIDASDESITVLKKKVFISPTSTTRDKEYVYNKTEFMAACNKFMELGGVGSLPLTGVSFGHSTDAQANETITTPAGTFDTKYTKMTTTTSARGVTLTSVHEIWFVQKEVERFTVKSITTTNNGAQRLVRVLTRYQN
ncbi:MAG: hypothetical protein ISR65_14170 [Bacteriovoracaceae bacterium]|nr:hypothetical protein [Bacteriovoracaceae bacterium]